MPISTPSDLATASPQEIIILVQSKALSSQFTANPEFARALLHVIAEKNLLPAIKKLSKKKLQEISTTLNTWAVLNTKNPYMIYAMKLAECLQDAPKPKAAIPIAKITEIFADPTSAKSLEVIRGFLKAEITGNVTPNEFFRGNSYAKTSFAALLTSDPAFVAAIKTAHGNMLNITLPKIFLENFLPTIVEFWQKSAKGDALVKAIFSTLKLAAFLPVLSFADELKLDLTPAHVALYSANIEFAALQPVATMATYLTTRCSVKLPNLAVAVPKPIAVASSAPTATLASLLTATTKELLAMRAGYQIPQTQIANFRLALIEACDQSAFKTATRKDQFNFLTNLFKKICKALTLSYYEPLVLLLLKEDRNTYNQNCLSDSNKQNQFRAGEITFAAFNVAVTQKADGPWLLAHLKEIGEQTAESCSPDRLNRSVSTSAGFSVPSRQDYDARSIAAASTGTDNYRESQQILSQKILGVSQSAAESWTVTDFLKHYTAQLLAQVISAPTKKKFTNDKVNNQDESQIANLLINEIFYRLLRAQALLNEPAVELQLGAINQLQRQIQIGNKVPAVLLKLFNLAHQDLSSNRSIIGTHKKLSTREWTAQQALLTAQQRHSVCGVEELAADPALDGENDAAIAVKRLSQQQIPVHN